MNSLNVKKTAQYCVLLLALLVLPAILPRIVLPDREQLYMGQPAVRGDAGCAVEAIFENHDDSDVVFVGSSIMVAAMRPALIDAYFSQKLGRTAKLQYLYLLRSRTDLHFIELTDYFKTHHAKLVVLQAPERFKALDEPDEPDVTLCDLLRFGEMPDFYDGISLKAKAAIYGEMVINGPRQVMNALRPNVMAPEELTRDYLYQDVDTRFGHIDFNSVPFETPNSAYVAKPSSPRVAFRSDKNAEKDYLAHFMRKISALCAQHGAKLLLLDLPMTRDPNPKQTPVNLPVGTFADDQQIVAINNSDLFGDTPARQLERQYFIDTQHLNAAGATTYSAKVLPAIYSVFSALPSGAAR